VDEKQRVSGFKAILRSHKANSYLMTETDGSFELWQDLSSPGRLEHIARDAAMYDVPFEPFAEAVRESIDRTALEDATLRLVLRNARELHDLEMLVPDDERTEPTPLVDRVKELLDAPEPVIEFERLLAEQRDDAAQRSLYEKGVKYEDAEPLDLESLQRESVPNPVDQRDNLVDRIWSDIHAITESLNPGIRMLLEAHNVPQHVRQIVGDYLDTVLREIGAVENEVVKLADVPGAVHAGYGNAKEVYQQLLDDKAKVAKAQRDPAGHGRDQERGGP
jgi:hypothetical protein